MKWIICIVGLLLLTGCGLKTQVVRVDTPNVHVNSENGPLIQVDAVTDGRPSTFLSEFPAADRPRNVGGVVRAGNGINVVLESTTTTEKVQSIIIQALRSMGYRTVTQCQAACVQLSFVLNEFAVKMPFNFWRAAGWSQQMVADISVHVTAQRGDSTRSFNVSGHGSNIYQVVSRENWETALNRAATDFSTNLKQAIAAQDLGVVGDRNPSELP